MPVGGELHHGTQEKVAFGKMRMWYLQRRCIDHHIVNRHNVNVYQTVDIATMFITMRGATQASFYLMDAVKHGLGFQITTQTNTQIHEPVLAVKSPRLTLDN